MAANPQTYDIHSHIHQQAQQEPVVFRCLRRPNMRMRYKVEPEQVVFDRASGRQVLHAAKPEQYICFKNGVYKTNDPEEIEFIRKHSTFTGVGDKKVITEIPKADPYQQYANQMIQQMGYKGLVDALYGQPQQGQQYNYSPTYAQQQDPAGYTAQQVQQQELNNGNAYNG